MTIKFKIVVPTYNTENWIQRCLFSIRNQVHANYECIIFNDASTDKTGQKIDEFIQNFGDSRFSVVHNEKNKKALQNIVEGFNQLGCKEDPESVLMIIDGDDYLFCEYSLSTVAQAYKQTNCLLTYGSFIHWPTGEISFPRIFPHEVVENNSYRSYKFISSHLRTFKSKLWYSIKDEDLRDIDGSYFKTAWDVAFMIPMLEMTGGRFLHIPNILYVYNRWNPLSDDVINTADQNRVDNLIRTRIKYERMK
jgi:glycosyltransferase involved in cell wall biosynthesis